jgi:hypothetical protein
VASEVRMTVRMGSTGRSRAWDGQAATQQLTAELQASQRDRLRPTQPAASGVAAASEMI